MKEALPFNGKYWVGQKFPLGFPYNGMDKSGTIFLANPVFPQSTLLAKEEHGKSFVLSFKRLKKLVSGSVSLRREYS